jgi:hypothetical protein
MGNGRGRVPTYHCQVESVALGEVGLRGGFGRFVGGQKGPVVRTTEAQLSLAKAKQPWKTLGIDAPERREH